MQTEQMISKTPNTPAVDRNRLSTCIDLCAECSLTCVACADACLGEQDVANLRRCIRLNLDCADICDATARVISRLLDGDPAVLAAQLEACARACASCGAECRKHSNHHEHCAVCAEACRRCEAACRELAREFSQPRA